jgi:hypothetical protein
LVLWNLYCRLLSRFSSLCQLYARTLWKVSFKKSCTLMVLCHKLLKDNWSEETYSLKEHSRYGIVQMILLMLTSGICSYTALLSISTSNPLKDWNTVICFLHIFQSIKAA